MFDIYHYISIYIYALKLPSPCTVGGDGQVLACTEDRALLELEILLASRFCSTCAEHGVASAATKDKRPLFIAPRPVKLLQKRSAKAVPRKGMKTRHHEIHLRARFEDSEGPMASGV